MIEVSKYKDRQGISLYKMMLSLFIDYSKVAKKNIESKYL